jgi:hypothetical protein
MISDFRKEIFLRLRHHIDPAYHFVLPNPGVSSIMEPNRTQSAQADLPDGRRDFRLQARASNPISQVAFAHSPPQAASDRAQGPYCPSSLRT